MSGPQTSSFDIKSFGPESFNIKALELAEREAAPLPHHFVARYVKCLQHYHRVVLLSWVFVSIILYVFGASKLMGLTRNEFEPPHGSASQVSHELITKYFPGIDSQGTDVFYLEVANGHSVVGSGLLKVFTDSVNKELLELLTEDLYAGLSVAGYYSSVDNGFSPDVARAQFVSRDESASFLVIQYPNDITMQYGRIFYNCLLSLQSRHNGLDHSLDHVSFIGGGGNAVQSVEANDEAHKSIEYMDLVSMPLAFAIFAVSLSSIRLILLPFVTLVVSYITAFGIMGLLARAGVSVSSATPTLMMSMLIAVSIDYSLFLLTRYTEEVKKGVTFDAAVAQMLEHSGHTVCASGFTLAFCFLALLFFPLHMMQSIGVGVIVSILSAIVVNLTLIPVFLLAHPAFFAKSSDFKCLSRCCRRSTHSDHTVSPSFSNMASKAFEATPWYRWAIFATSRRAAVLTISILVLLGGLAMVRCKSMHHSMDTWLFAPRVSLTLETFQRFSQHFPVGSTGPFQLLLLPNSNSSTCSSPLGGTGIYSEAFWTNATGLMSGIVAEVYGSNSEQLADTDSAKAEGQLHSAMYIYNVPGVGFQPSTPTPGQQNAFSMPMKFALFLDPEAPKDTELCNSWGLYLAGWRAKCRHFVATKNCKDLVPLAPAVGRSMGISSELVPSACTAFQALLNSSTTSTRDAIYATLIPAVLERSRESVEWTRRCREFLMANAEKYPCVKAHLNGATPQMVDAIDSIYERAPPILSITMVVCFILVSSLTSSLAFGLSSVSLIAWTLLLVFSIGDIVYQGNALEAFGIAAISGTGGLAWLVLPLTFSMIFGLGLDYNIFLLGRVCEFHCAGFGDREALAYGLAKTGPVISNAGLIMAVAFSGLLLSGIPMMNQVGFLLVVAVFIDTFFVRPLATPALHAPLKAWNWWPRGACNQ